MSINEGLWSAKLPNGDVRSGTLQQLSEAFRAGHIAESTLVCAAGSTNWIRLVDVLGGAAAFASSAAVLPSQPPPAFTPQAVAPTPPPPASASPATNGSHGLWQVKLPTGAVRSGTRQQLEEALRAGHLDENALTLAPGASEWSKVGALLKGSQPPPASMPPSVRPPPVSVAPPPRPSPASPPSSASPGSPGSAAPMAPPQAAPAPPAPPAPPRVEGNDMLWQLRLANGQVRSGTRRQLEDAFNAGHLDESEMVLPAGSSEWVRLGEVMDRRPLAPVPPPGMSPAPAPVAAEPPPVVAAVSGEPARVAPVEAGPAVAAAEPGAAPIDTGPAPASTEEGNSHSADAASSERATDATATSDAKDPEELWQVKLTLKQLEEAFLAGLLDDETPVLAERENEWLPLREFRSAQPPPFGSGLVAGAPHNTEPASRTEPWPANAGMGSSSSPTSEVD